MLVSGQSISTGYQVTNRMLMESALGSSDCTEKAALQHFVLAMLAGARKTLWSHADDEMIEGNAQEQPHHTPIQNMPCIK